MSEAKNRDTSDAKDAKDFARWIVRNDVETGDHACAQCWPGGEIVIAGFVCVYHRAVAVSRGTNSDPPMTSARFATHFFEAMASARNEEASTQRAPELRTTSAPPEGWTVAAWREDGCPCARCNVSMAWEGDDPDDASEALCGGCKHIELQALRERVKGTSDAQSGRHPNTLGPNQEPAPWNDPRRFWCDSCASAWGVDRAVEAARAEGARGTDYAPARVAEIAEHAADWIRATASEHTGVSFPCSLIDDLASLYETTQKRSDGHGT